MRVPPSITLRNVENPSAVEAVVRRRLAGLERFCGRVQSCRVVVEAPHRHRQHGNIRHVRIDLRVPGTRIVVARDPAAHRAHEDTLVAVRDAFDAVRRRLEDWVRRSRGVEKAHSVERVEGKVERFLPDGFGFIRTRDGRGVYFHPNSLRRGDRTKLKTGTRVRFTEEPGADGPQATSVALVTRRHHGAR